MMTPEEQAKADAEAAKAAEIAKAKAAAEGAPPGNTRASETPPPPPKPADVSARILEELDGLKERVSKIDGGNGAPRKGKADAFFFGIFSED